MESRTNTHVENPNQEGTYVVISGNGRSGSNRVLDIYDASRSTVCRNEVNEIEDTEFNRIGGSLFEEDLDPIHLTSLHAALRRAGTRRSQRDRLNQTDKSFLTVAEKLMLNLTKHTSVRHALSAVGLIEKPSEWALTGFGSDLTAPPGARLVLKLNSCPGWTAALAVGDSACRVVHNIRDPQDYLQSWYNRFIQNGFGTRSFEENFEDVPRILAYFGRDKAERLREPSEDNVVEVEVWRWRFINERLRELASLDARYLMVTYAEVEADAGAVARRLFELAGLPLDKAADARIRTMRNTLFARPHKTALNSDLCQRTIDKVLEDSPLKEFGLLSRR